MTGPDPGAAEPVDAIGPRPTIPRTRLGHLERMAPRLPALAPRIALADLPTPVTSFPDLARELGLAELLVKRDDATSSLYGGTKVRGLEFFFGRAAALGRSGVVTIGSAGSNHAVATATFARVIGMASRAILLPHPEPEQGRANVARLSALGADVRETGWLGVVPAVVRGRLERAGTTTPLWIAPGGSTGLGILGAAEGALEVAEEVRAGRLRMPEVAVVAAGSCGTAAGLLLGFALAATPVRVVAVRVVPRIVASRRRILSLARGGLRLLREAGLEGPVAFGPMEVVQTEAGEGYARPTPAAAGAVALLTAAGLPAETTYTGKAWAHVRSGAFQGRRVLFWNTFGG